MMILKSLSKLAMISVCSGLLSCAVLADIDDFARTDADLSADATVTASLVEGSEWGATGRVLSLGWSYPHKPWIECYYRHPYPVPDRVTNGFSAIQVRIWVPAAPSVADFSVRLVDAGYEIFQWSAKLAPAATSGWRNVVIPIDVENPASRWGGDRNGVPDPPLKLAGYGTAFANSKVPAGRILLADVRDVLLPKVELKTDGFPWRVNATGASTCELVISNSMNHPVNVTVNGTLTAFDRSTNSVSGAIRLAPAQTGCIPLPLGERLPGIRWFTGVLGFDEQKIAYETTFVIADPVPRATGSNAFLFGICSHPDRCRPDVQDREFHATAVAGATVMRASASWAQIEAKAGEWRWDVEDQLVALGARYGVETQPTLAFCPSHAVSPASRAEQAEAYKKHETDPWKITLFAPPEEPAWRRYVGEMARRYRGRIRLYEIWNEPDLGFWRGTTDQYLQVLRAASEEIRRADPQALVLSGGFATVFQHQGRAKNPNLQERVLAEASDAFDIHAFHQHGPFREFKDAVNGELQRMRSRMERSRPLYFNETAISSAYIGEREQALTLVKKMSFSMVRGAIGYTWYDLRNDGTNPTDMEHNYGLLTSRFRPKAAFTAYMEVVRQLHDKRPLAELNIGSGCESYLFGGTDGRTLVLWNEDPNAATVPLLFRGGEGSAGITDIMGVGYAIPGVEGIVMVQPAVDPHYITLPPGPGAEILVGKLVDLRHPPGTGAGQPVRVTAVLANPLREAHVFHLSWKHSTGTDTNAAVTVPAGGTASLPLILPASSSRRLTYPLQVSFSVDGTPWSGVIREGLPVLRELADVPPEGRSADWVMDRRADLVDLCQADPALAAQAWRGPDDLSAQVWLWRDDQSFRIRVDVHDDVHSQHEQPALSWRGDGVQLALQDCGTDQAWEIGAALGEDGRVMRAAWLAPAGVTHAETFFDAACQPIPGGLRYTFALPLDRFVPTPATQARAFRFNLLVNDNDGTMRKCFLRLAPGFGEATRFDLFPVLRIADGKNNGVTE